MEAVERRAHGAFGPKRAGEHHHDNAARPEDARDLAMNRRREDVLARKGADDAIDAGRSDGKRRRVTPNEARCLASAGKPPSRLTDHRERPFDRGPVQPSLERDEVKRAGARTKLEDTPADVGQRCLLPLRPLTEKECPAHPVVGRRERTIQELECCPYQAPGKPHQRRSVAGPPARAQSVPRDRSERGLGGRSARSCPEPTTRGVRG